MKKILVALVLAGALAAPSGLSALAAAGPPADCVGQLASSQGGPGFGPWVAGRAHTLQPLGGTLVGPVASTSSPDACPAP